MRNFSLRWPEKQKDSLGRGCNRFYTAGTWRMQWHSAAYAIYWKFGMTHMTSRPRQQPLVESLWRLLCWPVAAILRQLEGHNQGPVGLDYRCTRVRLHFYRYTCVVLTLFEDEPSLTCPTSKSEVCSIKVQTCDTVSSGIVWSAKCTFWRKIDNRPQVSLKPAN